MTNSPPFLCLINYSLQSLNLLVLLLAWKKKTHTHHPSINTKHRHQATWRRGSRGNSMSQRWSSLQLWPHDFTTHKLHRAFLALQTTRISLQHKLAFIYSQPRSYDGGRGYHAGNQLPIRCNMEFGVLSKDTLICRQQRPGIKATTVRSVDDCLYVFSLQSHVVLGNLGSRYIHVEATWHAQPTKTKTNYTLSWHISPRWQWPSQAGQYPMPPSRIEPGTDPLRHENTTSGGLLWRLAPACWRRILWVLWVAMWGLHGSDWDSDAW